MEIGFLNKKSNEEVKLSFQSERVPIFKLRFKIASAFKIRPDSFDLESEGGFKFADDTELVVSEESVVFVVPISKVVKVKVSIETDGFETALIETFKCCSVQMIKYFLTLKTNIKQSSMIIASSNKIESDGTTLEQIEMVQSQREPFSTSISEISSDYSTLMEKKGIRLNLLVKKDKKLVLGLDFAFKQIDNLNRQNFDTEAPSYREGTDGLNIMSECKQSDCSIKGEAYMIAQGQGNIEVKRRSQRICCPKCGTFNGSTIKLVFVNCEWLYSASLSNGAITKGDGRTYGESFFFTGLIDLSKFEKLYIQVKSTSNQLSFQEESERKSECNLF